MQLRVAGRQHAAAQDDACRRRPSRPSRPAATRTRASISSASRRTTRAGDRVAGRGHLEQHLAQLVEAVRGQLAEVQGDADRLDASAGRSGPATAASRAVARAAAVLAAGRVVEGEGGQVVPAAPVAGQLARAGKRDVARRRARPDGVDARAADDADRVGGRRCRRAAARTGRCRR